MRYGEIRCRPEDLAAFERAARPAEPAQPRRVHLEPHKVEQGLAQLVLSLVELVRRLLEKQALRRIEGGSLTADQIERLGTTLMRLEQQMDELCRHFEIENLDLDLGPLGALFDDDPIGEAP
jgi:Gas vesicle protein K